MKGHAKAQRTQRYREQELKTIKTPYPRITPSPKPTHWLLRYLDLAAFALCTIWVIVSFYLVFIGFMVIFGGEADEWWIAPGVTILFLLNVLYLGLLISSKDRYLWRWLLGTAVAQAILWVLALVLLPPRASGDPTALLIYLAIAWRACVHIERKTPPREDSVDSL